MKDEFLALRISKEDKAEIKMEAARQGRSVGGYLLWLWKQNREEKKNA
jgi:predicted HicB family RNase H-like nuclease